ncbi:peptidyl-lys metalloendopeptidase, partial [Rhizoctonia solani AG-3 Rhs1AP]
MRITTIPLLLAFFVFQASADGITKPTKDEISPSSSHGATSPAEQEKIKHIACFQKQREHIERAVTVANAIINSTNLFIASLKVGTENSHYTKFFGKNDFAQFNAVKFHFENMADQTASLHYSCGPCPKSKEKRPPGSKKRLSTYVNKFPVRINLCKGFWKAPLKGTDSQAGTIIRELSRVPSIGGTEDYGQTKTEAIATAKRDFMMAALSADNYMYFAEEIFSIKKPFWKKPFLKKPSKEKKIFNTEDI